MTTESDRLLTLELQRQDMATDIKDLKDDVKEFKCETNKQFKDIKTQIDLLSLQIAKWAGGIAVVMTIAQFILNRIFQNL
jgi:hypothetical protein